MRRNRASPLPVVLTAAELTSVICAACRTVGGDSRQDHSLLAADSYPDVHSYSSHCGEYCLWVNVRLHVQGSVQDIVDVRATRVILAKEGDSGQSGRPLPPRRFVDRGHPATRRRAVGLTLRSAPPYRVEA